MFNVPTLTLDLSPKLASLTGVSPQLTAPAIQLTSKNIKSHPAFFSFFPTSYSMRRFYRFWLQNTCSVAQSCPALGTPWTIGPAGLLCPWDSPGRNAGVGCTSLSRGSSWPRDRTRVSCVSCVGRQVLPHCATGSACLSLPSSTSVAQAALISHLRGCSGSLRLPSSLTWAPAVAPSGCPRLSPEGLRRLPQAALISHLRGCGGSLRLPSSLTWEAMAAPSSCPHFSPERLRRLPQAALISHLRGCSSFLRLLCPCLCLLCCLRSFSKQEPEWVIWKVGQSTWRLKS